MARNKKNHIIEDITIEKFASEGKTIAYHNGQVVFVPGLAPGDVVDLRITRKRKNHMEAVLWKLKKEGEIRQKPFCSHFDQCGGCKWQHIPYHVQTQQKHNQVVDAFERIGGVVPQQVLPIIPSPEVAFYRNKLEYSFGAERWLTHNEVASGGTFDRRAVGFHVPRRFDRIIDIDFCYLQYHPSNVVRNFIRAYALKHNLTFYHAKEHHGLLRTLTIRTTQRGQVMLIFQFGQPQPENYLPLLKAVTTQFEPYLTSVFYTVNQKKNDSLYDLDLTLFYGQDHITEQLGDLEFTIRPKSFFQVNVPQAHNLYKATAQMAALSGTENVYDLYTGTGSIALFVARNARRVLGIESVPDAITDAHQNAKLNGIANADFICGDMKDAFNNDVINKYGIPDVVIADPPRAGMHANVVSKLLETAPKRIVYVSCNPATQARDVALLTEKYNVVAIQPVDMFPHTYHVENIALLQLKY